MDVNGNYRDNSSNNSNNNLNNNPNGNPNDNPNDNSNNNQNDRPYNNGSDNYFEMKKINQMAKKRGQEKFQHSSRNRLIGNIKKKFNTTMIGALAAFEEQFGELWGDGLEFKDLTPEQLEERERWDIVRSQVLDNGNDQLRASIDEISHYTVSFNRYVTKFVIKN